MCAQMSKSCAIIFNNPKSKHSNEKKRTKTKKPTNPLAFIPQLKRKALKWSVLWGHLCSHHSVPTIHGAVKYSTTITFKATVYTYSDYKPSNQTSWFWCALVGALYGEGAERGAGIFQVWTVSSHKWGSRAPFPDTVLSEDRSSTFFFFFGMTGHKILALEMYS